MSKKHRRGETGTHDACWEIRPGLYRSDLAAALDNRTLTSRKIEVLVSLVTVRQWHRRGLEQWHPEPLPSTWLIADVEDDLTPSFSAERWIEVVATIRSAQRVQAPCLVHCSAGRSRSGIALAVALARIDRVTTTEAVAALKSQGLWRGCNPKLLAAVDQAVPASR